MEVPMVEYRETFDKNHFFRKITGILNILDNGQTAYYKIGYSDDGTIKPLLDVEKTLDLVRKALDELTGSSDNVEKAIISPDPIKYLQPTKEDNTVIIRITGNFQKPYFYDGNLCVRKGREQTVALRRQEDIFQFIAKSSNYKLLKDHSLIDWKDFMCNVFLRELTTPSQFKQLSERWKIGQKVTRHELGQIKSLYEFVKSEKWFDNDEDSAAKTGLLKVMQATEKTLKHLDRNTKQTIELSDNQRVFVFSYCNGFDLSTGTPLMNPDVCMFSPPGYYSYGDERKSLIKLLEILFPARVS